MMNVETSERRQSTPAFSAEALPDRPGTTAGVPSERPLFRQEVVEFQRHNRQWGRVVPLQPLPTRLMVWSIAAAVAAIIVFLFVGQYARKETVAGYLAPAAGTARIFAPQQGIVSAVHVEQGQHVDVGQPLLTVDTNQFAVSGDDVNTAILNTLEQQKKSLANQIVVEVRRTSSDRERLTAQMENLQAELGQLSAEIDLQHRRIRLLESVVESGAQLVRRGLVSELDQRRREDAVLEQRRALISLDQRVTSRQGELNEARFKLEQLQFAQAEKLQALRNELSTVEQRIAEVNGRRAYVIRAPVGGNISLVQASVGQAADPKRLQLEIVPGNSPLQAELFVPARAVGLAEVGQDVRILYDAFPYQKFGTYRGRIVKVSHTALTAADVATPVTLKETAYRVTVALDRPDVDVHGRKVPLQPDMLLRADIILETRTLMGWLLNPLMGLRLQG
jgi:membrane fusion protein